MPEQDQFDGRFPTVKSPNPENAEALKMAIDMSMPVLVVDDYNTMIRIIRNLLKQLGFEDVDDASDLRLSRSIEQHLTIFHSCFEGRSPVGEAHPIRIEEKVRSAQRIDESVALERQWRPRDSAPERVDARIVVGERLYVDPKVEQA